MSEPIDRIVAEAIKVIDWSDARYADEPFYPKCAQAIRNALRAAGYVIAVDPSPEALLKRSTDYLSPPPLSE